jgi:hypothetical protein
LESYLPGAYHQISRYAAKLVKSYTTKPERVCEISLKFQPPNTINTHSILSKLLQDFHSTLLPFLNYQANHYFLPQKTCRNKYFQDSIENCVPRKKRVLKIRVRLLKKRKRKVKVDPKFGGQRKEKKKVPMLGGQWKEKEKVPMLGGQWKVKEKSFSPLLTFPPTNFI